MKSDRIYLDHILECIGWIERFTAEGREAFLKTETELLEAIAFVFSYRRGQPFF